MRQATLYTPYQRDQLGLLPIANDTDKHKSLEQNGQVTDHHRALASLLYKVPYHLVTEEQRRTAKGLSMFASYQ